MDFKDSLRDIKSQMLAENGAKNLGGNGETAAHSGAANSKTRAAVSKDLSNSPNLNSNEKAANSANSLNLKNTAHSNSNSNDAEKAYYANLERKKEALQSEVKEFLGL